MHVELDKDIDLDYNTECAAITYANVLLTWAVSNPIYVVHIIYDASEVYSYQQSFIQWGKGWEETEFLHKTVWKHHGDVP